MTITLVIEFASHRHARRTYYQDAGGHHTRAGKALERIQQTGTTFFLTDLDLAMTMTHIASAAPEDSEKRVRNQANSRHAYDEISRMSRAAVLTDNEREEIDDKLAELRSALQRLGERFV